MKNKSMKRTKVFNISIYKVIENDHFCSIEYKTTPKLKGKSILNFFGHKHFLNGLDDLVDYLETKESI